MADRFDVAGRLAEGRVAIEHTQAYVHACHALGYQHPDLTAHRWQLRDWLDGEDGLNLLVLDRDCGQLRAAGQAVGEGLRIAQGQLGELTAAWTGPGSEAAAAFLQRHCDAASVVANEVRAAAQRCESLRDNLWHLLDSKVATVIAIDDRSQPQRASWLAAAAVVTSGTAERSTAEETVRAQVMPYVDNDIRGDWLAAMRSSLTAFGAAYDMVNDRLAAASAPLFEFPGDLGPTVSPPEHSPPPPAIPVAPVLASAPAATLPAAVLPAGAAPADPAPSAPAPAAPPLPDPASALGSSGLGSDGLSGTSDAGGLGSLGGLGGLASRIVDALGSLLGPGADDVDDPAGLDDATADDPFGDPDEDPFQPEDEDEHDKPDQPEEAQVVAEQPPAPDPAPVDVPADMPADAPPPAPQPAAGPAAPAAAAPVTPAPATGGSTPCEIAADQVPQAGQ
ncbi:hypothetical protein [Mycobacterium sherrisii]|uniref:Uncharacterized protein n=1 Tax=Mycobacterium sherrisii TaxID=243061 RepID=A0A1E3T4R0_9MYCO|nr:hypothetical protein [Mycobacterium sherrisii]MCV7030114.1 hypothetical protein [Mycobacterium sherrisii]MEC4762462.1 hypothetical protein [Mycobacterium sherrisii]ODR09352.1 hypothetical protein BHQ21_04570 [Mycobacterium sherrisii]ORW86546.1 hypothetical protein AWC25_20435 [Mycobacterium sherrisii]